MGRLRRIFAFDVAPDHAHHEVVLGEIRRDVEGALVDAVAEDRHALGEIEDFGQSVAHIEDAGAAGGEVAHHGGELADAVQVERRGGLVEEEDARLVRSALTISTNWR